MFGSATFGSIIFGGLGAARIRRSIGQSALLLTNVNSSVLRAQGSTTLLKTRR